MRKALNLFALACIIASLSVFTGCEDKNYFDPDAGNPKEVRGGSSTLDYSTTQSVELLLNYDVAAGFVSTFDVYTENPLTKEGCLRTDLKPITGGINVAGVSKLNRTIPAYVKDLYVYSSDLFVPQLMKGTIEGGKVVFEQVAIQETKVENENQTTRTIGNGKINKYLTVKDDYYLKNKEGWVGFLQWGILESKYDLKNPIKTVNFPAEILNAINQTFPEKTAAKGDFYKDALVKIESDNKGNGVRVYVSVAHAGCLNNNSLSYFVYQGNKKLEDLTKEERKDLKLINIFQYADVYTSSFNKGKGLKSGKAVQLLYVDDKGTYSETFPVGAQIGFVLHAGGFNESDFNVKKDATKIYSIASWNNNNVKKTIYFGAKDKNGNPYNFFGFEDMILGGDNDCNDVIFNVLTDPIDAIDPPKFIPEEGTVEKTITKKGVLAFEDNWPKKGDYDLNDAVVKYNSTITYIWDAKQEVEDGPMVEYGDATIKQVEDIFSMAHAGATFKNAFSYKVNIASDLVKNVKVDNNSYTPVVDGNGFIIDLCADVKEVVGTDYKVTIEFNTKKVLQAGFDALAAPYNPFIQPTNPKIASENIEVHLPFYPPTERADMNLFGSEADCSDVANEAYYANAENIYYPFAIHLSEVDDFTIPVETRPIDFTYPKYTNWVNKGCGTVDADWYLYPNN
ncbi:LruC domain-containing protein [Bacteroides sp. 224]|uniref:LruC domain-containing protein n=1 Tax=Bacteroides sp. 224 TaxID=2302936 RepID=UPI0013D773DF|nr:LruC domain-containing protein [Bacteroides sp. 224]NDV66213.1 LruC domain-containing protein [Bacteroides sp. 224]